MTTTMAVRWGVGKTRETLPLKERYLFGLINTGETTTLCPRKMTPVVSSGYPGSLEMSRRPNLSVIYPESSECNDTDRLEKNTTQESNHESHTVQPRGLEAIVRCDGTMGCSPDARLQPLVRAGMPESWKDKAESLGVNRLKDSA